MRHALWAVLLLLLVGHIVEVGTYFVDQQFVYQNWKDHIATALMDTFLDPRENVFVNLTVLVPNVCFNYFWTVWNDSNSYFVMKIN